MDLIVVDNPAGQKYGFKVCGHTVPQSYELKDCPQCKSKICPVCDSCKCGVIAQQQRRLEKWGRGDI